jgi:hypothetical protein
MLLSNPTVTPKQNLTPKLTIVLDDIRATRNPANFSDQVKIIAVFGNNSSNSRINATSNNLSTSTNLTNMIVCPSIKNSAGLEIGRVNLKRTSGNEYARIWNATYHQEPIRQQLIHLDLEHQRCSITPADSGKRLKKYYRQQSCYSKTRMRLATNN